MSAVGIMVLSPDGLFIRMIDTDLWTLMFLRGLFMGLCMLLINGFVNHKNPIQQFKQIDKHAWAIIGLMVVNSFFFVASIQTTSVAHTLIIVGSTPIVAAILGLIFLREKLPLYTWVTIFIVVIGLVFVVFDDQQSSLQGDLYALIACILWSFNFILARLTRVDNMIAALTVSGFAIAVLSFPLTHLESVSMEQLYLSASLGLLVGIAFSLLTLAPRYMPTAQVALFMPLETVFGTLLVWWILHEYPGIISLSAGGIIIAAIMMNSYFQIRTSKN